MAGHPLVVSRLGSVQRGPSLRTETDAVAAVRCA